MNIFDNMGSDLCPSWASKNLERKIYTLGTGKRGKEEFIHILKHYEIELIMDVRRFPKSRFEHFNKDELNSFLKEEGIDYLYLGRELGGYRKGGYERHMETPIYEEGLKAIEREASLRLLSIICAERLPWRCHRRFIGTSLMEKGWKVIHIIDIGRTWDPWKGRSENGEQGTCKGK